MLFGQLIAGARKRANLSQKELAALLKKEDGQPISPQYLNDIEHGRRNPPSEYLIQQLAEILHIEPDVLYFYARQLPADIPDSIDEGKVIAAYKAFRRELERK